MQYTFQSGPLVPLTLCVLDCPCFPDKSSLSGGDQPDQLMHFVKQPALIFPINICLQLVANTTVSAAAGQTISVYASTNAGGMVSADTVIFQNPNAQVGICQISAIGTTQGCVAAAAINSSAMACASRSYSSSACTWIGIQCTFQGVTNDVSLDLTTCSIPSSGTLTLTNVITDSGQVKLQDVASCLLPCNCGIQ